MNVRQIHTKIAGIMGRTSARATPRPIYPEREWIIGMCVGAVLLILGMAYAGISFMVQLQKTEVTEVQTEAVPQYDERLLNDVLEAYRARKEAFETLRGRMVLEENVATTSTTTLESE